MLCGVVRRALPAAARAAGRARTVQTSAVRRGGGGGHHGPMQPPFRANPLPKKRLHNDYDLIWDDGTSPELILDLDVPQWSGLRALLGVAGGFGAIFGVYKLVEWSDPPSKNAAAPREHTIPWSQVRVDLGMQEVDDGGKRRPPVDSAC